MTRPKLPTRVARAEHGRNVFFGHAVEEELLGRETTTSLLILAVTGRRATEAQIAVLDDVATVLSAADPRIWLFKAVRLASAYGGIVAGLVAGNLCGHRAFIGALTASEAATLLRELRGEPDLRAALRARIDAGRLVGFGVPFRERDERAVALAQRLAETGRSELPFQRLLRDVAAIVREERGLEPNLAAALGACFLDLGFEPREVGPLVHALGQHAFLANAVEGAEQSPAGLRRLPHEHIAYTGAPPRLSPRALAARAHHPPTDEPRILILDDDPMIRRALERLAEDRGDLVLHSVSTPDELQARLAEQTYDLVVCDYRLDPSDHEETSATLVTELAARGIRVAVVTGSTLLIEGDLGVPVLEKPIRLDDLVGLIRS